MSYHYMYRSTAQKDVDHKIELVTQPEPQNEASYQLQLNKLKLPIDELFLRGYMKVERSFILNKRLCYCSVLVFFYILDIPEFACEEEELFSRV